MDSSRRRMATGPVAAVSSFSSSVIELPEYIVTTFMPSLQPLLAKYPFAFRVLGVFLALWYFGPLSRIQSLWSRFSSLLVSSINVSSEEDLFDYLMTHLSETRTLRADQSLNALSNVSREQGRRALMRDHPEESNRKAAANNETPKLKYEQTEGLQLFVFQRRLFWATRKKGEGSTFTGRGYKNVEVLAISCFGRSTAPVKALLEHIYFINKDKERTLTIIRRPYTGGYGGRLAWSRITAKPRRALDTVILDQDQKSMVLRDVEEYMDEATSIFYGRHGIPYRRGYLFHGPPGVGKTSFALAIANKFNLDVYVLTLLDQNLNDSDLVSLLNQLPGRSLLLLEDIDTAGLSSRKPKSTTAARLSNPRSRRGGPPGMRGGRKAEKNEETTVDSDDDEFSALTSKVSLSGLLNAIDGVAAPEGHILIMTTNKPHELDDALVRAGRISVRVKFDNASHNQAEEIFRRMYVDPLPAPMGLGATSNNTTTALSLIKSTSITTSTNTTAGEQPSTAPPRPSTAALATTAPTRSPESTNGTRIEPSLDELATTFANALPELEFSPADLQDYLLVHKKSPHAAIENLETWMRKTREEKERKEEDKEIERLVRREKKKVEEEGWKETIRGVLREDGKGGKGRGSGRGGSGGASKKGEVLTKVGDGDDEDEGEDDVDVDVDVDDEDEDENGDEDEGEEGEGKREV